MEKLELTYTLSGNVNGKPLRTTGFLTKLNIYLPYDPGILILGLTEIKIYVHTKAYTNIQSSPKLETQTSINWRLNKQIVIYLYYHEILLSNKKSLTWLTQATWISLQIFILNEKANTERSTYCMTIFIQSIQNTN